MLRRPKPPGYAVNNQLESFSLSSVGFPSVVEDTGFTWFEQVSTTLVATLVHVDFDAYALFLFPKAVSKVRDFGSLL